MVQKVHRRGGFTLVELLVVIGIMSVLISIMLPALNKARAASNNLVCQSNLRQIGVTLSAYAASGNGLLPYGEVDMLDTNPVTVLNWSPNAPWYWVDTLSLFLGTARKSWTGWENKADNFPGFLRDVDTFEAADIPGSFHYICNPRLMPLYGEGTNDLLTGQPMRSRKLSSIRESASVMVIWDGPQDTSVSGGHYGSSTSPVATGLDHWQMTWGHGFCYPTPAQSWWWVGNYTTRIAITGDWSYDSSMTGLKNSNIDYPVSNWGYVNQMRFRHKDNTTANFLFADGHVESRRLGEVQVRDVCVNP